LGGGQYYPSCVSGQLLIAHLVAHSVQQSGRGTRVPQFKLAVSSSGDAFEHEADAAAVAMVRGAPATVTGAPMSIARKENAEAKDDKKGKGDASAAGGLSTKGATVTLSDKFTKPLTGEKSVVSAEVSASVTGTATFNWPDPGLPVDAEKSAAKGTDKSEQKTEVGIESPDIPLWTKQLQDDIKADKSIWDGFEFKEPLKLVFGAKAEAGASKDAEGKETSSAGVSGGIKVVGTLKNGTALSVSATALSVGMDGDGKREITGPKLSADVTLPPLQIEKDDKSTPAMPKGCKASAKATLKANISASPNYKKLAEDAAKQLAEKGAETGISAIGAAAAIELGAGLALAGSVFAAFAIGADAITGNKEAAAAAEKQIHGVCSGFVAGVTASAPIAKGDPAAFGTGLSDGMMKLAEVIQKVASHPGVVGAGFTMEEVSTEVLTYLRAHTDQLYTNAEQKARPAIAKKAADARYHAQMDHFYTMESDCRRDGEAVANLLKFHGWSPPKLEAKVADGAKQISEPEKT
jgi:hypothetical protein